MVNHQGVRCDQPDCECPVQRVFERGVSARVTHVHRREDGGDRYLDIVATPILNSHGQVVEVVELLRDVTEEYRVAENLRRNNLALSVRNNLSAVLSQSLDLEQLPEMALDQLMGLAFVDQALMIQSSAAEANPRVWSRGLSEREADSFLGRLPAGAESSACQCHDLPSSLTLHTGGSTWLREALHHKGRCLGEVFVGKRAAGDYLPGDRRLVEAIAQQVAISLDNARLHADLQDKERRRGILLRQVISAQEEERKRIARELHDETIQRLTAIIMNCAALEHAVPQALVETRSMLSDIRASASLAIQNSRRLIYDLRPEALDDLGLELAVRGLIKERLEDCGVRTEIEFAGMDRPVPQELELTVFRIIQEAVSNIARHAEADRAQLRLVRSAGRISILVEDNGRGFEIKEAMSAGRDGGWGLNGMAERASLVNAEMMIQSRPGSGTSIRLEIPMED